MTENAGKGPPSNPTVTAIVFCATPSKAAQELCFFLSTKWLVEQQGQAAPSSKDSKEGQLEAYATGKPALYAGPADVDDGELAPGCAAPAVWHRRMVDGGSGIPKKSGFYWACWQTCCAIGPVHPFANVVGCLRICNRRLGDAPHAPQLLCCASCSHMLDVLHIQICDPTKPLK
jgi:hypothetical protein